MIDYVSVSYSNSLAVSLIINEEIANSMHHSSIVHTIFVERSAIKMYGHSLTLCSINVNVSISYNVALHFFIFVPMNYRSF